MEIKRVVSPLLDSNMYIVSENNHCIIIDPYNDEQVIQLFSGLTPDFMLVTHEHYDHISGINAYKERFGIPLYANRLCDKNLQLPSKNYAKYFKAYAAFQESAFVWEDAVDDQYSCHADIIVEDGQMLDWEGHQILIKMAPGHSAGSNLIIIDDNAMFSGDCMLSESVPAARFPGGDPKAFQEIVLPYLKSMNQDIQVYPGHYDSFCLREYYILK